MTPALREWYVEGDAEELEYAAGAAAARASLRLLAAGDDEPAPGRAGGRGARTTRRSRCRTRTGPRCGCRGRCRCGWSSPRWSTTRRPLPTYAGPLAALAAADAGDDDAAFVVESVEDHELGWWAVQELPALVAP